MEFLFSYGLFLAKALTVIVAVGVVMALIVAFGQRQRGQDKGHLEVVQLNEKFEGLEDAMKGAVLDPEVIKHERKQQQKTRKAEQKQKKKAAKKGKADDSEQERPRVFVLDFDGDIRASAVASLREEISAVLTMARSGDEVVVRLESGGGLVHSYGLASSQLDRIKKHNIPLTVCVDKVAASGGYMMACVADRIVAAPFAILGSIGVVAQMPNFHRLLKQHNIDFELLTAGEHKRTLTVFGENTDSGRQKFIEDLEDTHELFKSFVTEHRPVVEIASVATGEVWFGRRALEQKLVDELKTSDEYLVDMIAKADVYEVSYVFKKNLQERLGIAAETASDRVITRLWERLQSSRWFVG